MLQARLPVSLDPDVSVFAAGALQDAQGHQGVGWRGMLQARLPVSLNPDVSVFAAGAL
jgi:hypothetical protein